MRWRAVAAMGLMLGFILLRTLLLPYITSPEPRYVLECYPAVIVMAAAGFERRKQMRHAEAQAAEAHTTTQA